MEAEMTDRRWKQIERLVCAIFGSRRSGPTGLDDCDCDRSSYPFGIEIKHGASYKVPAWLRAALEQAKHNAKKRGPDWIPVVVVHQPQTSVNDSLLVIPLRDFLEWYGPTPVDVEEDT